MARPSQEAVETFMGITGVSESVALQKLEEYGGNMQEAVNAHFSEGGMNNPYHSPASFQQSNFQDMNRQSQGGHRGLKALADAARHFKPSLLLDPSYRRRFLNQISPSAHVNRPPPASHPLDMRQDPLEFNGWHEHPHQLASSPRIEDANGSSSSESRERYQNDDIEEQMIKAAIEVSKQEEASATGLPQRQLHQEDDDLARALSLSLKTAEQENAMRKQQLKDRAEKLGVTHSDGRGKDDKYVASLFASIEKEIAMKSGTECLKKSTRRSVAQKVSLPQEPLPDDKDGVNILVRMPDGSRLERRFLKSDKLQLLFDFIDIGKAVKPETYRVVRPYPRHAFGVDDRSMTLSDVGLISKQEALFLELI